MRDINATIRINLEGRDEQSVWKAIKYTRRKYVQQAIASGLSIEQAFTEKDLKKMFRMNMKTLFDGGTAKWTYDRWKGLVECAGDKFFYIKMGENILGCFALAEITEKLYGIESEKRGIRPVMYSSIKKHQKHRTNDYMYWATIKSALDRNYDFLDLGGWQINPRGNLININKFKEEWGGEIYYYYLDYPLFTTLRRKLIRNSTLFWNINQLIKRVVGTVGKSTSDQKIIDSIKKKITTTKQQSRKLLVALNNAICLGFYHYSSDSPLTVAQI